MKRYDIAGIYRQYRMPVQLLNAMLGTLVLITLSGVSAPVTLRSRNAVDYVVDSRSAASHSTRLRTLIANLDEPGDTIPLPNVCDAELQTIVEFINNIPKRQVCSIHIDDDVCSPSVDNHIHRMSLPPSGPGASSPRRGSMRNVVY